MSRHQHYLRLFTKFIRCQILSTEVAGRADDEMHVKSNRRNRRNSESQGALAFILVRICYLCYIQTKQGESRSFQKIVEHLRVFEFRRGEVGCARNQTYSSYFIHTDVACNCVRMVSVCDLSTLLCERVIVSYNEQLIDPSSPTTMG